MTRLALSSYDLWRDILATNSDPSIARWPSTFKSWNTYARICERGSCRRSSNEARTGRGSGCVDENETRMYSLERETWPCNAQGYLLELG